MIPYPSKQRTVSTPNPPMSPPQSPSEGGTPRQIERPDPRLPVRHTSMDSTESGASSALPATEATSPTSAEISALIIAAGSAEAAIAQLIREKKHAANQNAQLFRLVQKQRSLIYGLNQDLEKAVIEKEKFRKHVRDDSAHMSPVRAAKVDALRKDSPAGSTSTQSEDELPIQRHSVETSVYPSTTDTSLSVHDSTPDSQSILSSSQIKPNYPPHNLANRPTSILPIAPLTITKREIKDDAAGPSASSFAARRSFATPKKSPGSGPASPSEETVSPSLRKGPPAPLNLGRAPEAPPPKSPEEYGPEDHSDSEYDDTEVDQITGLERGRKKTRAEDDLERQMIIKHEQESRSLSKKQKGQTTPKTPTLKIAPSGVNEAPLDPSQYPLPKSPLAAGMGGLSTGGPVSPLRSAHLSPHASIAGLLSSPNSATKQTFLEMNSVSSPPMSPGLPLSPRPSDRPIGAPAPRQPREGYITAPPAAEQQRSPLSREHPPPASPGLAVKQQRPPIQPELSASSPKSIPLMEAVQLPSESSLSSKSPRSPIFNAPTSPRLPAPASPLKQPKLPETQHREESLEEVPSELTAKGVYRGLVTEEHPNLLLPPSALTTIVITVTSSRLKPSRQSTMMLSTTQEEPVFTLGVTSKSNSSQLWRVEKPIMSLPQLDYNLKQAGEVEVKLPERSLFTGHAPVKIDARRVALEAYFESILNMHMTEQMALIICRYFSSHVIPSEDSESVHHTSSGSIDKKTLAPEAKKIIKEGYLTKRGKQFGGWKARFFVLDEPILRYYDAPGGSLQGTIKLYKAQIGRQSTNSSESPSRDGQNPDNQFRHAFLIMEPKKRDASSHVRHVLCAENDQERDEWVYALLQYVNVAPEEPKPAPVAQRADSNSKKQPDATPPVPAAEQFDSLQGVSYEDTTQGEAPRRSLSIPREATSSPVSQFGSSYGSSMPTQGPAISGPRNGAVIQDASMWGNKSLEAHGPPSAKFKDKEPKKRGMWGIRDKLAELGSSNHQPPMTPAQTQPPSRAGAGQQPIGYGNKYRDNVFGVPLNEAVEFCVVPESKLCLPAVVYRCLTYLDAQQAYLEEGIFRLSGSSTLVRQLKEKFNTDGDLDLLADDTYYDVHAIASLLKLWLRELPTTVLTKRIHDEFLAALDIESKAERVKVYCMLVHQLPLPNWTLVRCLSDFLLQVINHSDVNKMGVRNVGIIFAPTLAIPAPVFASFVMDFDAIFNSEPAGGAMYNFQTDASDEGSPQNYMLGDNGPPTGTQDNFSVLGPAQGSKQTPGPGLPQAPNNRASLLPPRVPTPNHNQGTSGGMGQSRPMPQSSNSYGSTSSNGIPQIKATHNNSPLNSMPHSSGGPPRASNSPAPYETQYRARHNGGAGSGGGSNNNQAPAIHTNSSNGEARQPSASSLHSNFGPSGRKASYETALPPQPVPSSDASYEANRQPTFSFTKPHYETNVSFEPAKPAPTGPPPPAPPRQSTLVQPDRSKYTSGIGQLEVMRDTKARRRESAMMFVGGAPPPPPSAALPSMPTSMSSTAAKRKSTLPPMGSVPGTL